MCELYEIIAESELLQPTLNEIHKFCFQHWSHGRDTCGTGSGALALLHDIALLSTSSSSAILQVY